MVRQPPTGNSSTIQVVKRCFCFFLFFFCFFFMARYRPQNNVDISVLSLSQKTNESVEEYSCRYIENADQTVTRKH